MVQDICKLVLPPPLLLDTTKQQIITKPCCTVYKAFHTFYHFTLTVIGTGILTPSLQERKLLMTSEAACTKPH